MRLDLFATLNAVRNYLNGAWEAKWQQHKIGSLGQVILILAPLTHLTETEQQTNRELLREIKHLYPGNKKNNVYIIILKPFFMSLYTFLKRYFKR